MSKPKLQVSPDQGYEGTPCNDPGIIPSWMHKRTDHIDATPPGPSDENEKEQTVVGTPSGITAVMPVSRESEQYNMSHAKKGTCLIFNHEKFAEKSYYREGSSIDAKRIEATFTKLGFNVVIRDNLKHSDVLDEINKLTYVDHTNNDCVCVFLLTHGRKDNEVMAFDGDFYSVDEIWKPFIAGVCPTLAGKPKLFFYQACRGVKLVGDVPLTSPTSNTGTDSAVASYTIPTDPDFLIARNSVDGVSSWRNPEEGTWYIQCLCSVLDEFAETTDLMRMLTITARKVATEFQTRDSMNVQKNEQKQVPSTTTTLTKELYFKRNNDAKLPSIKGGGNGFMRLKFCCSS
ncbi:caspase-1-like [Neodiprion virginianus]|uniref:caspase-1-like n=1 Tax=Neodiprion virginianus TaxID=2961670 RepID=UPI001EE6F9D7|nr:caspase-1-like [Neodiprion virginianus]